MTGQKPQNENNPTETFSLEDLDQILEEEDPGFNASLESIKKDGVQDTSSIEAFSVDSDDDDSLDQSEIGSTEKDLGWKENFRIKTIHRAKKIKHWYLERKQTVQSRLTLIRTDFKNQFTKFYRHTLPERIKYYRSQAKTLIAKLIHFANVIWEKPRKQKIAAVLVFVCVFFAIYMLAKAFKGEWLPGLQQPIVNSYDDVGKVLGSYKSESDFIPLFEAFPEVEFQVRIQKIVVNLRPDKDSGQRPMGLFEFYLGVDSRDTAVELRDREKEILDLVQRTVEGFTYSEIMSKPGKARMKSRIKDNLNSNLNQGRVMNVYLNRIVTSH